MRRLLLVLHLAAAPAAARDFSTESIGTASADFLTIDVGARAVGMAGAYTAIANDPYSLYWNPAGLAQVPKSAATFMHHRFIADINFDYGAYAHRINDMSVLAGAFRYMDAGSIAATDINGGTAGYFRPQAFTWEIGWGQYIPDLSTTESDMTMGASFRYAHSDLIKHADLFAGDIGLQQHYFNAWIPWRFGAAIQNMGQGPRYDEKRERLPVKARLGAALHPSKFWILALDGTLGIDQEPSAQVGTEVTLDTGDLAKAFLRGGIDTRQLTHGLDGFRAISFGLGIKTLQFAFDYSFSAMGDLGDAHRFSVSFSFPTRGGPKKYRER